MWVNIFIVTLTIFDDDKFDFFNNIVYNQIGCNIHLFRYYMVLMHKNYQEIYESNGEINREEVVQERGDGSSDWLNEKCDIDLGNGYKECSNWNQDLTKIWDLEIICPEIREATADELVQAFNIMKEQLFPGKEKLTPKEEIEVYNRMYQNNKK